MVRLILHFFITSALGVAVVAGTKIRVGAIFPKVGPMADAMCVAKATAHFVNHGWGLPIEIVELDNRNNEEVTFNVTRGASNLELTAVIGTRTSQEAIIAANQFEKDRIPFLAFMASHPDVVKNHLYSLRLLATSESYAEQMANELLKEKKSAPLVIVRNTSIPYSDFYGKRVAQIIRARDPKQEIVNFEIINGYKNYANLVKQIDALSPGLIYAPLYTMEFTSLVGELSTKKRAQVVYSSGGFTDGIELIEKLSRGNPDLRIKFNGVWNQAPSGRYARNYYGILKTACGAYESNLRTALAFDSVMLIASALKKQPTLRGLKLVAAVSNSQFDGVSGRLSFSKKSREPSRRIVFHEIQNGALRVLSK